MNPAFSDRIVSILSYITMGIFSIIWLIFANLTNKHLSPFLTFNLYQAIFISIVLYIISFLYQIAIGFLNAVPFINTYIRAFDIFFNQTPLYFSYTVSGLVITLLLLYLSLISLFGKKPFIPVVSNLVKINIGE